MNHRLTKRELQVLELIAEGYTDQEISNLFHITVHTANSHRKKLLSKLGAVNAAVLVRIAMRRGYIR